MRFTLPGAFALLAVMVPTMASAATPIAGRYVTEDGAGVVTVGPCGNTVCGKLTTILKKRPGAADTDVNNSDPSLRSRPVLGMPILSGFSDNGKDWRGKIYDPRNGKTYKSIVAKNPDGTLNVKGCIAFFCQSQVWHPAK
ncbi:MAG: DUF2147 domain-containing protein [Sphingomonas taxi]|uniref:DUF2147 domain-containing protein n=1 Tax=Sphingomonas taxi TaxID=1549858 RepID=A0A2W5P7P3_9SPHN|nr:MAG: DUF2147 domain-containing protein [Sphingomonas taxi]